MSPPKKRDRKAVVLAVLLAASGLVSAAAAAESPRPEAGGWAVATLGLLQYSHGKCTSISESVSRYWGTLGGSEEQQENALERYVLSQTTKDMASAREALDIVRRFLPEAKREADSEAGIVLERLFETTTELCNAVARPVPPRDAFTERLGEIQQGIENVQKLLSRLLAISAADLQLALAPYLQELSEAGRRAEEKNRRDTVKDKVEDTGPTPQEIMAAWHQHYAQAVTPAKQALGAYLQARQANDSRAIQAGCKELLTAVQPLLDNPQVFRAPDKRVEAPLINAFRSMRALGGHCTSGRFDQVDQSFQRVRRNLADAAQVLRLYSLSP